ncbi:unnamed protein product [Microthlaspi erraticum]|uniref:Malectin domain-containing protein n=1 Tax=Microthlaspi erraticum TaxID=1685480 RepID=A0A6D2J3V7_9BRAS|nr:unnamed protein product [Microthlaspi erraticum]
MAPPMKLITMTGSHCTMSSPKGWVLSNTGHFLDDHRIVNSTIWSDASKLSIATDPHLYVHARLSALSLTYYAKCLQSREYKVKLHFAEIMFSRTRSYKSLGRRYFDIYIQLECFMSEEIPVS